MTGVPAEVLAAPDTAASLAAVVRAIGADTGTLHFAAHGGSLVLAAVHGTLPAAVLDQIREIPQGKGMAGLCAHRNEPVTWCNLSQDATGAVQPGARGTGLKGSIVVPVRRGSDVVGTLGVANRNERNFSQVEVEQLLACAAALARFAPSA